MKRILITIALFLSINNTKADAPLILEYNYTSENTKQSLAHLEADTEFCCYFEIATKQVDSLEGNLIKVIDKKSGTCLGVLYGVPNKEFLMKLYAKELSPESVEDIVTKLNETQRN
jgi:hypothetical protein